MPGDERGREPARCQQPERGDADSQDRRLRVLGQDQLILRALEDHAAERLAQRRVRFVEGLTADRERIGKRLAHADLLRALTGKENGDHAISRSTRSMKRLAENR